MRRPTLRTLSAAFALLLSAATWASGDGGKTRLYPDPALDPPNLNQTAGGKHTSDMALTPIRAVDVARVVRDFIGEEAIARDGFCRINDPVENATLDLKLKDVYADKLMKVQPNTFVTCATLASADGVTYDVDFYVKGTTRKNLKVVDATIHAKEGRQRYAWADEKGLMRVKALSSEMPMRDELAH